MVNLLCGVLPIERFVLGENSLRPFIPGVIKYSKGCFKKKFYSFIKTSHTLDFEITVEKLSDRNKVLEQSY